ncbi:hypothetical protein [Tenacibaculum singaporense]|uniref:hypothetical protein n=1 Tax=Tenacibaculum singaporense TaxID=2358479 RepID=UPI000F68B090|nr:hypothetical protein [Tenacibaculum singaporense]RSC92205.1 hypothetical protein EI424_14290 [Tenacibaculum singaporense]
MVILKKIKASSLNEVIIATIVIVLIFGIAIATLNNIMQNTLRKNTKAANSKLNELVYQYKNQLIKLPYNNNERDWLIHISKQTDSNLSEIEFEITSKKTNTTVSRKIIDYEKN